MTDFAFKVDLAELDALIARMGAFEQRAQTLAGDVDSQVHRLHGEWSGRAAAEQLAAHRQWRHGAAEVHDAAVALRSIVSTAHGNYGAAVSANARMWG